MSRAIYRPSGEVIDRPKRGGLYMWGLAILVGVLAALAVVIIQALVMYAQFLAFGAASGRMSSRLVELPWWSRMIGPIVGGALICLLLRLGISWGWGPAPRAFGLQDIVQNRRLRGTIRSTTLSLRDAFLSALVAIVSLGWGGSSGREEPAAHLGASLAMLPGRLMGLNLAARRMLLGMGLAAAISAALHAPIAGVFLARELVLRRLRLSQMGPVVVASVSAWLFARWLMDGRSVIDIPDVGVILPQVHLAALAALPVLAMFAYAATIIWARTPVMVAAFAAQVRVPLWLLPVFGGVILGVIALAFPQVLGIGYEPLAAGLGGNYTAVLMPVLALAKIAAAAVTFGFRWGGGPIAPSLYVGAMIGASLGVAAGLLLGIPAPQVYFGLLGMAIALAVLLDAPFTGAILAAELSGSPEVGAASLLCCFVACMAVRRLAPPMGEETGQMLRWR
ncbi:MAG: chloride channel protein [Hyphomonadaceae bacterium]|nr:chloride channel protein [Hyphomonadaceae bacterium]